MNVGQLMTRDVITVAPGTPLRQVAELLATRGISGVPVVEDGVLLGVVSEADIVAKEQGAPVHRPSWLERLLGAGRDELEARLTARTAGEAMTAPAITIEDYRAVSAAAQTMGEHGINRLPVVHRGALVGLVTRADLVRAFARPDDEIEREIREDVIQRSFWQPQDRVTVAVEDGDVLLHGEVDSEAVVTGLPVAITRVPGVVSVHSELRLAAKG